MELIKRQIRAYDQEQKNLQLHGFPKNPQLEFFLHSDFPAFDETCKLQETVGSLFSEIYHHCLTLFPTDSCNEKKLQKKYISLPEIDLPFYMTYFDERFYSSGCIPQNKALLSIKEEKLSGILNEQTFFHITVENKLSRGLVIVSREFTKVHFPYRTYRTLADSRIVNDTTTLLENIKCGQQERNENIIFLNQ